jgi:hypothetical protein
MPKYSIFVGQQEPAANQYLADLDSRILDVSYRMLLHQNQGDPALSDLADSLLGHRLYCAVGSLGFGAKMIISAACSHLP